jgi:hypothetical protein
MDFAGDWNESRLAEDWINDRPQRPVNLSPTFDLGDDLANWNQPLLQNSDAGHPPMPLRAIQQDAAPPDQLRAPFPRPPIPSSLMMAKGVTNASWDGQDSTLAHINEQIGYLLHTIAKQNEVIQSLSTAVQGFSSRDRKLINHVK